MKTLTLDTLGTALARKDLLDFVRSAPDLGTLHFGAIRTPVYTATRPAAVHVPSLVVLVRGLVVDTHGRQLSNLGTLFAAAAWLWVDLQLHGTL